MEDFLGGVTMIPLIAAQPNPKQNYRSDGGLLSTLSSYLMTPYSSSGETFVPDATDADIENTLCTIDCITACRLDELYSYPPIRQFEMQAQDASMHFVSVTYERDSLPSDEFLVFWRSVVLERYLLQPGEPSHVQPTIHADVRTTTYESDVCSR